MTRPRLLASAKVSTQASLTVNSVPTAMPKMNRSTNQMARLSVRLKASSEAMIVRDDDPHDVLRADARHDPRQEGPGDQDAERAHRGIEADERGRNAARFENERHEREAQPHRDIAGGNRRDRGDKIATALKRWRCCGHRVENPGLP